MTPITHKQAIKWIDRRLDRLLNERQLSLLDEHLNSCESCRTYAAQMGLLPARLQNEFHARWDALPGPSPKVFEYVTAKARRIPMLNRVSSGVKLLAGIAILILLGFIINFVASKLQNAFIAANDTEIPDNTIIPASQTSNSLITFAAASENGDLDIYTVYSNGSGLKNLTNDPEGDAMPAWSPNGKQIAFVSTRDGDENIYVMDADGSNLIRLTDDPATDNTPLWSPDGTKIAYTSGNFYLADTNIYVMDADGKNRRRITNSAAKTIVFPRAWSPDSQYILFNVDGRIVQANVNTGEIIPITPRTATNTDSYTFSKDGSIFSYFTECNISNSSFCYRLRSIHRDDAQPDFTKWLATFNTPEHVCPIKKTATSMGSFIKWSPDQTKILFIFTCEEDGWIYLANADGSDFRQLTSYPIIRHGLDQGAATGDWSPDSQSIVFTSALEDAKNYSLYTLNINDALQNPEIRPTLLNAPTSQIWSPSWQPALSNGVVEEKPTPKSMQVSGFDGLIAFYSEQTGDGDIYAMHADGSEITNLTNNPANDNNPLWSPDGTKIAFTSDRTGNTDIFLMNSDGSELTQLTDNPGYDGSFSWSPNGQKIVYLSSLGNDPNTESQLMIMNPDGSDKAALTGKGSFMFLGWSPDSQKILYQKYQPDPSVRVDDAGIYAVDADGQNQREWFISHINGIHWEDSDHFVAATLKNNGEQRPTWILQRFSTDGNSPVELGYHSAPIVAIFDKTYIVESQDALRWHALDGKLKPLSTWNFNGKCKKSSDQFLQDTNHLLSPDGKYAFVTVYCPEGITLFYFENADGSEIKRLTDFSVAEPSLFSGGSWSPDGKYIIVSIASREGDNADLYLFDIEKMLKDPSIQPVQLTTDGAMKYGAVWQPKP